MADTTFTAGTLITSSWLNDINDDVHSSGRVNVKLSEYGAIGDGASHPLSAFFATLGEAQARYPHALSLTDELDGIAIQAAINYGILTGKNIYFSPGRYIVTGSILADLRVIGDPTQRKYISLIGAGSHLCSIVNSLTSLTDATVNVLGAASSGINNGDHGFVLSGLTIERLNTDYQGVCLVWCWS